MMPNLQLGPVSLPLPALIILLGLWLGITLSERNATRFGVKANHLSNLLLIALTTGLIGARMSYIARYPYAFIEHPIDIVSRNPGLLDPIGGLAVGLILATIYSQRKRLPLWPTLDSLTPALALFGIALALSNLASGNAYGRPTDLPWGIELWGAYRHPTQIYNLIVETIIFMVVWQSHKIFLNFKPGTTFLCFVALTASSQLILESFRGDSILLSSGIRQDQIVAWLILAFSLWGLGKVWYTTKSTV